MTTVSATFQIARQRDSRAPVKWLNLPIHAIPSSDDFRDGLTCRHDQLFYEDCGDLACWWLAIGDKDIISETAALADQAGLVVAETATGWTAIEPDADLWSDMPGAYFRWTAEISTFETECGEIKALWINRSSIADDLAVKMMQGVLDWHVAVRKTRDAVNVTYTHKAKMAA